MFKIRNNNSLVKFNSSDPSLLPAIFLISKNVTTKLLLKEQDEPNGQQNPVLTCMKMLKEAHHPVSQKETAPSKFLKPNGQHIGKNKSKRFAC